MREQKIFTLINQGRQLFKENSLFRNATYLMLSTAIMSVLGFGFWIFVAHLYKPSDIGMASALISLSTLVSNLSMLGMNSGIVRFLPSSKNQSRDINTAILVVAGVTLVAAFICLLFGSRLGSDVGFFTGSPLRAGLFMVMMAMVSLNSLTDAVFIANRRAEFHTIVYAIFGVARLVLPLFMISLGMWGIFTSYIVAVVISLALSLIFMKLYCGYKVFTRPSLRLIGQTRKYAVNNYVGIILSGFAAQILPSLIVRHLGASSAAYFSMAWTMANLLYIVPSATTQSLLAESSHDPAQKTQNLKQTIRILTLILTPAIILSILVAPVLMKVFGPQYSRGSTLIFQILAASTIFIAVSSVCNTMLNIERRSGGIVAAQAATLLVTLGSVTFLWPLGLPGVGIAMALGYAASNAVHVYLRKKQTIKERRHILSIGFPASQDILERLLRPYGILHFTYEEFYNGSSNRTFLIKDESGSMVLRVYRYKKRSNAQIGQEIRFIRYLANRSLPVPKHLVTLKGNAESLISIDDIEWQYLLMRFEPGVHPQDYSLPLLSSMARLQAVMHCAGLAFAGEQLGSTWLNRVLDRFLPRGFSHFDFDATNILVGQNSKIRCILDFEGMRFGPLVICLYYTLTRIYDQSGDMDDLRTYLHEYQRVRRLNMFEKIALSLAIAVHGRRLHLLGLSWLTAINQPV